MVHPMDRGVRSHTVNTASFEDVAGAVEHERPFLSPLNGFLSLPPRGVVRTVPASYLSRLQLRDGDALLGDNPSSVRTDKRRQDRDRRLGTRTRRRTPTLGGPQL